MIGGLSREGLERRFWAKVDVRGPDECWPWRPKVGGSYGAIKVGRALVRTHRLAWMLQNGPLASGVVIRHRCDNPPCCNPAHLEPGTQADNVRDIVVRGRRSPASPMRRAALLAISRSRATTMSPLVLRAARVLVGWSRKDLAKHSDTSPDTVQSFENRGSDPKQSTILAWRRALSKAGVEFIDDGSDGKGPGVRLRDPQR